MLEVYSVEKPNVYPWGAAGFLHPSHGFTPIFKRSEKNAEACGLPGGGNSVPARPERARERCEGCSQAGTTVGSGTVMHDAQAAGQTG